MPTYNEIKLKGYTNEQLERLGNTILFLIKKIHPLYKTKLLKLIYLLDELSTARNGVPFLGLDYKVWQAGPVIRSLRLRICLAKAVKNCKLSHFDQENKLCLFVLSCKLRTTFYNFKFTTGQ